MISKHSRYFLIFAFSVLFVCFETTLNAQTLYYDSLIRNLNTDCGLPLSAKLSLGGDERAVMAATYSNPNGGSASFDFGQPVSDDKLGFEKELVIKSGSIARDASGRYMIGKVVFQNGPETSPVKKGSQLVLVFWARGSNFEIGNRGSLNVGLGDVGGNWYCFNESILNVQWKRYLVEAVASRDGILRVLFQAGKEDVEIGGVAVIDYGLSSCDFKQAVAKTFKYNDYAGKGCTDDGRYDSAISTTRKVEVKVVVNDKSGKPITGAGVQFHELKQSFPFGGEEANYYLLDPNSGPQHQKTILDVSNTGTYSNGRYLVSGFFTGGPGDITYTGISDQWSAVMEDSICTSSQKAGWDGNHYTDLDEAINWFGEHGVAVFMHALNWGDSQSAPSGTTINNITNRISNITNHYKGKIWGYHINNEGFARRKWENSFYTVRNKYGDIVPSASGYDAWTSQLATWFKTANAGDPSAKLYLSDNDMLEGGGLNEDRIGYYLKLIADLKAKGAPITGMAFESHFGNDFDQNLDDIDNVKNIIDRFGALGVKVRISEFDFFNYASQIQRVNYLRDFLTVCFSDANVDSFTFFNRDGGGWANDPYGVGSRLIYNENWNTIPTGLAWQELVYGKYWTDDSCPLYSSSARKGNSHSGASQTDATGSTIGLVFKGDYNISVKFPDGLSKTYKKSRLTANQILTLGYDGSIKMGNDNTSPDAAIKD